MRMTNPIVPAEANLYRGRENLKTSTDYHNGVAYNAVNIKRISQHLRLADQTVDLRQCCFQ